MVRKPRSQGCRVCVERRVRCDLTRPFCKRCATAKRQCPGFTGIQFVDEGPAIRDSYEELGDKTSDAKVSASPIPSSRSSGSNGSRKAFRGSINYVVRDTRIPDDQRDGWQHGAFERVALVSLFAPTVYQDHLFASFLASIRQPGLSTSLPSHTLWLAEVAGKSTLSSALTWAIRAISISQIGRRAQDDALIETSRFLYGKALQKLNLALSDADEGLSSDTLSATLLLSFYEIFNCTSANSWIRHAGGAGNLIRIRGPARHRSGFDRLVFFACRYSIIMEAFQHHKPCFLDSPSWQALHWDLRNEIAENSINEEFFQEMVTYPGYICSANKMIGDPIVTLKGLENLHTTGISTKARLRDIYDRMCQAMPRTGNGIVEIASPTDDKTFPLVNEFPNLHAASMFCGYRTLTCVINLTILGLEAKMAGLYDSTSPPKARNPASAYLNPGNEEQSSLEFTRTSIWDAAKHVANTHGYVAENTAYARDVCKSAEYMARAPFLGPFFLLMSIRSAMRMEITREEKMWIVKKMHDIGRSMGMGNIEVEKYKGTKEGRFVAEWEAGAERTLRSHNDPVSLNSTIEIRGDPQIVPRQE